MPDVDEKRARLRLAGTALAFLGGIALIKIIVATLSGRTNIGFLVALAVIACIVAAVLCHPRVTSAGRKALNTLRVLVRRLEGNAGRLRAGGATNEALLMAAVLGLYALPVEAFAFVEALYPKPKPADTSSNSSDGGSSGSSGCGGGGGCGGCGGS